MFDLRRLPDTLPELLDLPECVSDSEMEQHVVGSELGLVVAKDVLDGQIVVHVLERLHALGQVLVVDLLVEILHVQLAQSRSAVDVKAGALLHQVDGAQIAQALLSHVLCITNSFSNHQLSCCFMTLDNIILHSLGEIHRQKSLIKLIS